MADATMMAFRASMMHRDRYYEGVCCAICGFYITTKTLRMWIPELGGVRPQPRHHLRSERDIAIHDAYYFFHGRQAQMKWLGEARLIGSDPWSSGPQSAWSGRSPGFIKSHFDIAPHLVLERGLPQDVRVYYRRDGHPFVAPVHEACHTLLLRYLGVDQLDYDVLHGVLLSLTGDSDLFSGVRLTIDYSGRSSSAGRPAYTLTAATRYRALSPVNIPALDILYRQLLAPQDAAEVMGRHMTWRSDARRPPRHSGQDPFARLPGELLVEVAAYLSATALCAWRSVSYAAASVPLGQSYWRRRLDRDMPYLYDIPVLCARKAALVNWSAAYACLSAAASPNNAFTEPALVSRREIWEKQCAQIARPYLRRLREGAVEAAALRRFMDEARVVRGPCMLLPRPVKTDEQTTMLLDDMRKLATAQPVLVLSWARHGVLVGLAADRGSGVAQPSTAMTTQRVAIPAGDWIAGLSFTVREDYFAPAVPGDEGERTRRSRVPMLVEMASLAPRTSSVDDPFFYEGYMPPHATGVLEHVVVGVEVRLVRGRPLRLGSIGPLHHHVSATIDNMAVGIRVTRQVATSAVARVALVQVPTTDLEGAALLRVGW